MKKILLRSSVIVAIIFAFSFGIAYAATGTIESGNHTAQLCETTDCTVSSTSSINFGYFANVSAEDKSHMNVVVHDSYLSGYVWGQAFGYISLDCANEKKNSNTGLWEAGVCTDGNTHYKVANDGNGVLSGWAWGDTAGWVNFNSEVNCDLDSNGFKDTACGGDNATSPVNNFKVTINSSGEFTGYAWTQNFGYIKFDCSLGSNFCVKTDWRKTTRDGGSPPTYECSDNKDNDGDGFTDYPDDSGCVSNKDDNESNNMDYCPYILGPQSSPDDCPPIFTDYCPQDGIQSSPSQCPPPPLPETDYCPAIDGIQKSATDCPGKSQCELDPASCEPIDDNTCTLHPESCHTPTFCEKYPNECKPTSGGGNDTVPTDTTSTSNSFFKTSGWNIGSKLMSGLGIAAAALAPLIGALFLNPLSFYDIGLLIGRLWTLLLVAFGLKKRTPPWGVVYDSVTKQPLDPAYVVLTDMEGNEIATSITDIDGRYGFLVGPGMYKLMANKSNYNFPSVKLAGKNSDELYGDLYFGETIEVTQEGGIIAKNIPLDQVNFDWNEFAKKERALTSFYHHRDVVIARVADVLFVIGFAFSVIAVLVSATTYNICIVALYVLMVILKRLGIRAKPKGEVYEGYTRDPVPFSIVRVLSTATGVEVAHRVSNRMGKYYCLISNGEYKIVVDKKNPDGTYTKVPIETPVVVDKGYIKKDFRL